MKALSIVAVVIAGVSFVIPIYGVFTAILASVLGLISFRNEATLSGVAVGLNLVNTAFFSPSILIAEGLNVAINEGTPDNSIYLTYVGIHVVILVIGIILAVTNKNKEA
jgi:ABC-type multidrug transport system permease subunit